jgi:hypothetical protein
VKADPTNAASCGMRSAITSLTAFLRFIQSSIHYAAEFLYRAAESAQAVFHIQLNSIPRQL